MNDYIPVQFPVMVKEKDHRAAGSLRRLDNMTDVYQFVDEIFKDYGQYSDNFEEDQMLPSRESLLDVCRILLNVSCLPEEGRYSTFRVCFISPDSE